MTRPEYDLRLGSEADRGPDVFEFRSADGVLSKDAFRTAELLLLEAIEPGPATDVLVVDGNYGVVGTVLGALAPDGRTTVTTTSARAATLCERNADRNGVDVEVALVADLASADLGEFGVVAYAPRPYDPVAVGRQRLVDALAALRPGGEFYLAGREQDGFGRYRETLADLAGGVTEVAASGEYRAACATRPDEVESRQFADYGVLDATVRGEAFEFVTYPGVFAANAVDDGTRLLCRELRVADGDRVLDLACGYGVLGSYALATADCRAWFTDDDRVVTECVERGLARNELAAEAVVTADCAAGIEEPFDAVVTNPPTHAGMGVLRELFDRARDLLAPDGEVLVVHRRAADLDDVFGRFDRTDVRRRESGYDVVALTK